MATRRSFLRSIILAAVAPQVLIPAFEDSHRWKRSGDLWVENLDWKTAKYEIQYAQFLLDEWILKY